MAGLAANLPDAVIDGLPALGSRVGHRSKEPLRGVIERPEVRAEPVGGPEQLTVDVELPLGPRAVPHAHGPAVPPPGEVRQLPLAEIVLAADPEHDLEIATEVEP